MLKARMRYSNMFKSGWMYYSSKGETPVNFAQLMSGTGIVDLEEGDKNLERFKGLHRI